MILITGATGTIGSQVLRLLAARGVPVRAMTRNPSGSQWPDGVDVVLGDFGDADSLDRAVDGIESAFLLTAPGGQVPDHDRALVKAASAAGLRKLVKLSAIGTTDDPADGLPGSWHSAGEQAVRESGLAWTLCVRPGSLRTACGGLLRSRLVSQCPT